jgi:putative transcriptional regulator
MGSMRHAAAILAALAFTLCARPAAAQDLTQSLVLVAKPEMTQFYRGSVLLVRPLSAGAHVGVIVNRPTPVTVAKLFPDHSKAQKVTTPVFLGGPVHTDTLFALVQRPENPGGQSISFGDNLYLAIDVPVIDGMIEQNAADIRFIVGLVVWRPGELEVELGRGMWLVPQTDARTLMQKPSEGLWEELMATARRILI